MSNYHLKNNVIILEKDMTSREVFVATAKTLGRGLDKVAGIRGRFSQHHIDGYVKHKALLADPKTTEKQKKISAKKMQHHKDKILKRMGERV